MPELPEVKTIIHQLKEIIPFSFSSISKSKVHKSILHTPIPKEINHIKRITRHGKCLIFHLNEDFFLLSHLGMTGSWRISEKSLKVKHVHFQFKSDYKILSYVDPRRFGHMYFFNKSELDDYLKRLGPDLLSNKFTVKHIQQVINKYPKKEIKPLLLEQKFFAGSGNYIANEVCARAKILPQRLCESLNSQHAKKIKLGFDSILNDSIKNNGVTFQGGYSDTKGEKGQGVNNLVVFHQKICGMCKKSEVIKISLKKRGTFYCPKCQK